MNPNSLGGWGCSPQGYPLQNGSRCLAPCDGEDKEVQEPTCPLQLHAPWCPLREGKVSQETFPSSQEP